MKHLLSKILAVVVLTTTTLFSCVKDIGKKVYQVYTPTIESTSSLRSKVKSMPAVAITNAGKLFTIGNYIFLNEKGKGIHIIDNTNPANPTNLSFINIPGNYDVAVKNNTLYADCYTDILAIDITNPTNVVVKNFVDDIFSDVRNVNGYTCDAGNVITGFTVEEKTMDIEVAEGQGIWTKGQYVYNGTVGGGIFLGGSSGSGGNMSSSSSSVGKAGSMSRFALINDFLYAVSNSTLNTLSTANANNPIISSKQSIGWNIETIYPFKDKLFIGSQTGMMIYDVTMPTHPTYVSGFSHARLCDPVITDGNYAYVTLHASDNVCVGTKNELDIIDITKIYNPSFVKSIDLTKPHGLDKDGNLLFVCDDDAGIRVFDASNPNDMSLKTTLPLTATYDIICNNGVAIVSTKTGIHQYNYTNSNNITKLSSFNY